MIIDLRIPTIRVGCDHCRHSTEPLDANITRQTVEIKCQCVAPEIVLFLGFPGRSDPVKLPLEPVGQI